MHTTVQGTCMRYQHALHTLSWVLGPSLPTTWAAWSDPSVPRGRSWPPTAARTTSAAAGSPAGPASCQTRARDRLAAARRAAVAVQRVRRIAQAWPRAAAPSAAPAAAPIDLPGTHTSSQAVRWRLWIGRLGLKNGFEGRSHTFYGSLRVPIDHLEAPAG